MLIKMNSKEDITEGYRGFETAIVPFSPRKVRDFCCCTEKCKQIKKIYNYNTIQFKEVDIQR